MSAEKKEYFVGIDMGTNSVGWAVTDTEYNLMRKKGKDLWGVRLFQEAKTAEGRRAFRTSRRNRQREQARNSYLKEIFREEINKVDPNFFNRLEDSFIKQSEGKNPPTLFRDASFTDKEYYEKYPTIFHLIKELISNPMAHDVRLVYLACLNIYKHRGHFLNSNLDGGNGIQDISYIVDEFINLVGETELGNINKDEFINALKTALPSKKLANSEKKEIILKSLILEDNHLKKQCTEIAKLLCGLKGSVQEALGIEVGEDDEKLPTISFRDGNYDESEQKIAIVLSSEDFEIVLKLKEMHDWGLVSNLMMDENGNVYPYLSFSRVASFEKHEKDLKVLKYLFKKYGYTASKDENGKKVPSEYDQYFRLMNNNNYSWYSGSVNSKYGQFRRGPSGNNENFFKELKTKVSKFPDCEEKEYVLSEIEKGSFLPKQLTSDNGVIPYQLHYAELECILNNAKEYLSFLNVKDESGLSVKERLLKMFEFRVPYYVGPLYNDKKDEKDHIAWSIRKEDGRVLPWNFEEKIDIKKSSEEFIRRMVRHCTYFSDEEVLPKNSLLYEKFMVLNELNNLKIGGEKISFELKEKIFERLLAKGKKVSIKELTNFLKKEAYIDSDQEIDISGIDKGFNNSLKNHKLFKEIFGVNTLTDNQKEIAERIIYWSTIYGDDKDFLKEQILENYGEELSEAQLKRILGVKFNDWGNLSKSFLLQEGADKIDGEVKSIIQRMWDENINLMEVLSEKYTYTEEIEGKTKNFNIDITKLSFDDLDIPYISNPVKRMVWQTVLILKELYSVIGYAPTKVFVEMARSDEEKGEKGRKDSRKRNLERIYKKIKDEKRNWLKEIGEKSETEFRSKKLYLYYIQQGKCMYTGENIDLMDLLAGNTKYDIDHIYPRHFVKDDSLDNNLVLVKREINNHKQDSFPIENAIQSNMSGYWSYLRAKGLISEEKFKRLTRKDAFTNEELANFINRQLTETQQGTKLLANIVKSAFEDCEIVYSKAGNVSEFRTKRELYKCREINDLHHAGDAYLNIVVGNAYNTKFTKNPLNYITGEYRKGIDKYHLDAIFNYNIERNGYVAWNKDKSMEIVRRTLSRQTPLVTYMNYEVHGQLFDQQLVKASDIKNPNAYIPIKTSKSELKDVTKYGGYNKFTGAYFFLVEHEIKGKRIRSLEAMPLYLKNELNSKEKIEEYCVDILGYEKPSVRLEKIKMYSKLRIDGFDIFITGRTGERLSVCNAYQLKLGNEWSNYIKRLSAVYETGNTSFDSGKVLISKEKNIELYMILAKKLKTDIYKNRPNQIYDFLLSKEEIFASLLIEEQCKVLLQILVYFSRNNQGVDLSIIGSGTSVGAMRISKKLAEKEVILINESVTGLFTTTIDLLTI